MLGDTAVAVHPEDDRYRDWSKTGALPITGRLIPILADVPSTANSVPRGQGHAGTRPERLRNRQTHNLPAINVMNPDGTINSEGGPFEG